MSRKIVLALLALLLLLSLTHASRPLPANPSDLPQENRQAVFDEESNIEAEEGCEGLGEDECLIRRSLAAHTDYIYTQKTKP